MLQSLREAVPLVIEAIASSIVPSTDPTRLRQLHSALKCLEAWMPNLPSKYAPALIHSVMRPLPTSDAVLQRRNTPSTFLVPASRPNIVHFPAYRFRRLVSVICPRFCGRRRFCYVDDSAPPVVRTGRPTNHQHSSPRRP